MLTPEEIINLAGEAIPAAQDPYKSVDAAIKAISAHNAQPGAKRVEAGPLTVVRGNLSTALEQLAHHVRANTPKVVSPSPQSSPPGEEAKSTPSPGGEGKGEDEPAKA